MTTTPAQAELNKLRHSAAHLLAAAVKDLWPGTHNAIGPAIENGFYQDFDFSEAALSERSESKGGGISEKDFPKIEKRMRALLNHWGPFVEQSVTATEAKQLFADNPYKLELIELLATKNKPITVNNPGNFLDLCKGGHLDDSKQRLKYFTLTTVAGAYWRGDANNPMLTRIYGTAFFTDTELAAHLEQLAEAKKRDHRVLGKQLDLFVFSPLVGPGLPLFTPRGTVIREELLNFVRTIKEKNNYKFVHVPHIAKAALYQKSGHLGKYDAMMPTMVDADGDEFVLKAMNCPHHFELFNASPRSYRDLPLRLAENTAVYRNEKSGELSGLMRVASLTQDDTHHFIRHDQIETEISMILDIMKEIYQVFNFTEYHVQLSVRDPAHPEKYFGDDSVWQKAEGILIAAVKAWGADYTIAAGEAAFYGPKIDIMVKDAIGRTWQLTTLQLDFVQPENFAMRYTAADGKKYPPAVLHVAILGSVERFMGILIEHYAGNFPLWLAPLQVAVLPVSADQVPYAATIKSSLDAVKIRCEIDSSDISIGKKIREAETAKVPVMLIIGKQEETDATVTVRWHGQKNQDVIKLPELQSALAKLITNKKSTVIPT